MELFMPVHLYHERGCVRNHGAQLASCGEKALIVTGRHSSRINGSLRDVMKALEEEHTGYVVFDDIEENPSVETVMRAREIGVGERVDFVVGVGGGSPMDAAKAIALMTANPGRTREALYEKIPLRALPVVEVPTTAGTGSEVTPYAILTIHKERTKRSISHRIFPKLALADPAYLETGGAQVHVNTAVDTLAHLVESRLNTNSDEYNRMYSERGLAVWGTIKEALESGEFTQSVFSRMMEACALGGMAISHTGTSLPHGLSYMVTYEMGVPHGKAAGIFLAGYVKCYAGRSPEDAKRVLSLLGFEGPEAFGSYLDRILGRVEMGEELAAANVKALLSNQAKLANYPYPVAEEELAAMKLF